MTTATELISAVEPKVLALAELLAPAVRAEPALIRQLRIELLPDVPAAAEAALWFSPLVQSRSAGGVTLAVDVAVELRQRLADQVGVRRAGLERARAIYAELHGYLSPPLRLEEDLAWDLVFGDRQAIEQRLTTAIAAIVREPDEFRFWVAQAAGRLPDGMDATPAGARMLKASAGGAQVGGEWEAVFRHLPTRPLVVRHFGGKLHLGGPIAPGSRRIDIPDASAVPLSVAWSPSGDEQMSATVVVERGDTDPVLVGVSGTAEVRTPSGTGYRISAEPFVRPVEIGSAADANGQLAGLIASRAVLGLRPVETGEGPELVVDMVGERVTVLDASRRPLPNVPSVDASGFEYVQRVAELAAHVSRWLTVSELRSTSPDLGHPITVGLVRGEPNPSQRESLPVRNLEVASTETVTAVVDNIGQENVFITVLALASDWSVSLLPGPYALSVAPGTAWSGNLGLSVTESETYIRLVAVASRQPFDPSPLALPAIQEASEKNLWAPSGGTAPAGLDAVIAAMTVPSSSSVIPQLYTEWVTAEAELRVHPLVRTRGEGGAVDVGHGAPVLAVAFSPDGHTIATAGLDITVRLWDAQTGAQRHVLRARDSGRALAFSPDGLSLAYGNESGGLQVWDTRSGETRAVGQAREEAIVALAYVDDGAAIATVAEDGSLTSWDPVSGRPNTAMPSLPLSDVSAARFAPNGRDLVLARRDGSVDLVSLRQATAQIVTIGLHSTGVEVVAFSPDLRMVASAGSDGSVQLWDVTARPPGAELAAPRLTLPGHRGIAARAAAFSPRASLVATGGDDGTVRLWDTTTGVERAVLETVGAIAELAFSPDGATLASAGGDGLVHLWPVAGWSEVAASGAMSGPVVSRPQLQQYVDALRAALGSPELQDVVGQLASALQAAGDPVAAVEAIIPDLDAVVTEGSAGAENAPFLARDPTLSLLQSGFDVELRKRGIDEGAGPGEVFATAVRAIESLVRPVTSGPDDPEWISEVANAAFGRVHRDNHPFNPDPAAYEIGERARLVLVGNWGSGVPRAAEVGRQMALAVDEGLAARRDVHVVHLGDVYYSGLPEEVERHMLAPWPVSLRHAGLGVTSWSLAGEHDMYSGGYGYFTRLLGDARFASQRSIDGRPTSFFRLTSPDWDVIGLDTAWDAAPRVAGHFGLLAEPQADFVRGVAEGSGRDLLLLTHHPLVSAYAPETVGPILAAKLAGVLGRGRVTAWFWAHEHRCMGFEPTEGVAIPRCIGHGGVPVTATGQAGTTPPPPAVWEEQDAFVGPEGSSWARLGFAVLDFDGPAISVSYRNELGLVTRRESITGAGRERSLA